MIKTPILALALAAICGAAPAQGPSPQTPLAQSSQADEWGSYSAPDGRILIVARWPNDPSLNALYDSQTGEFAHLTQTPQGLCTTGQATGHKSCVSFRGPGDVVAGMAIERDGSFTPATRDPIRITDLDFEAGGVTFKGRVWSPADGGRRPAVVLIGGSGKTLRDDFRIYPYLFARAGYVVYAFDKRGSGDSGGDPVVSEEAIKPLAADNLAAVAALRALPDVDPAEVGILGVSHGAWVAVEAAHEDPKIAFLIPVVGGGVPLWQATLFETHNRLVEAGYAAPDVAAGDALMTAVFASLKQGDAASVPKLIADKASAAWFKDTPLAPAAGLAPATVTAYAQSRWAGELSYDPAPALAALRIPILAISSADDRVVPGAENLAAIKAADPGAETLLLAHADHRQSIHDGDDLVYAPSLQPTLSQWLTAHKAGGRTAR